MINSGYLQDNDAARAYFIAAFNTKCKWDAFLFACFPAENKSLIVESHLSAKFDESYVYI